MQFWNMAFADNHHFDLILLLAIWLRILAQASYQRILNSLKPIKFHAFAYRAIMMI